MAALETALDLNPQLASAHFNKGLVLAEFRHYREAVGAYNDAIEFNSQHVLAHFHKGLVLQNRIGDYSGTKSL